MLHRALLALYRLLTQRPSTVEGYWQGSAAEDFTDSEAFFQRLPDSVDVRGKRMLDVGCGTGTLCLYAATQGAARVVGVDADENHVAAAKARLEKDFPELAGKVDFVHAHSVDTLDEHFDIVTSKDAFEHFEDPRGMVAGMKARLAPGGILATGFGPFWRAPYGGHLATRLPWLHLVFPTSVAAADFNMDRPGRSVSTWQEMGIGMLTYRKFSDIMASSGLREEWSQVNVSANPAVKLMTKLRRIPGLGELMTTNVYGVWRRT